MTEKEKSKHLFEATTIACIEPINQTLQILKNKNTINTSYVVVYDFSNISDIGLVQQFDV